MSTNLRISALLSLQRALLGEITENMRAVIVSLGDKEIKFRVVFSGNPSSNDEERVSEIETEVIADFFEDVSVTGKAEASNPRERIQYKENEVTVFRRAENLTD